MGTCFFVFVFLLVGLFTVATAVRWFEQTADAVDQRLWSKLILLVLMPFAVWLFRSLVSAGRPTSVPRHEPVRGFGGLPKGGIDEPTSEPPTSSDPAPVPVIPIAPDEAGPPPGTPREFIGLPKIPPKRPTGKPAGKPAVDPDKLARLRQKMREQGMLDGDDEG